MAFIDYYKILGVSKDIPQKDIRSAYRKRAKEFHPDLHPNDVKAKAKFQALNEAYDVLSDPDKRKKYDQYGERWREADMFNSSAEQGSGGFGRSSAGGSPFDGFDFSSFGSDGGFSSFFQDLFGGGVKAGGRRSRQSSGNSGMMNASVDIGLKTALLGGEVVIQLNGGEKVRLKVKPETQNGTKVRLRGKGYDKGDGTMGDLIITYNVVLPTGLTEYQKSLIRQAL
ncbi:J domain-containing protein [Prevotella sp. A2931]|uniref:J domain-containing protein n=1 Tax=Prevotella illustrans TaxID=2800387 RepID=A0ABS3M3A9_9BACT|nr:MULTISPECIES: DnaJ domain-containing protein [Prevotella]MBO1362663.1 J domain-containing protein [Prevotella illustrans]PTL25166.1 heat-shock protein [Prevotella sp. oral taxon 820]